MKKIGVIAILGLLMVVGVVYAYQGDYNNLKGPNFSEERHELMQDTFTAEDYDSWVELMAEVGRLPRVLEVVTEENFGVFVKAHEAAMEGDLETARELRAQLGLNDGNGPRDGTGFGKGKGGHGGMKGQGNGNGMHGNRYAGNCPLAE